MPKLEAAATILVVSAAGIGAFGVYKLFKEFTDPNGWGSVTQNGLRYSLFNTLFLTPNQDGHIYDATGSIGQSIANTSGATSPSYLNTISGGQNFTTYAQALSAFANSAQPAYPNGLSAMQDSNWPYGGATIQAGFEAWKAAGYPPLPTGGGSNS